MSHREGRIVIVNQDLTRCEEKGRIKNRYNPEHDDEVVRLGTQVVFHENILDDLRRELYQALTNPRVTNHVLIRKLRARIEICESIIEHYDEKFTQRLEDEFKIDEGKEER